MVMMGLQLMGDLPFKEVSEGMMAKHGVVYYDWFLAVNDLFMNPF